MTPHAIRAFAPGRVNLIGEHTDYNDGLCLPFAIELGRDRDSRVAGRRRGPGAGPRGRRPLPGGHARGAAPRGRGAARREARHRRRPAAAGRALLLRGPLRGARPRALRRRGRGAAPADRGSRGCALGSRASGRARRRACSTSSRRCSARRAAPCGSTCARSRPARSSSTSSGHVLATLDSGAPRSLAASGYNERRDECRRALELLGLESLRDADDASGLPAPLDARLRHVISENERVDAAVAALESGEPGGARPAAERVAREPARRLRGLGSGGRARGRDLHGGRRARGSHHGRRLRRLGARAVPARRRAAGRRNQRSPWPGRSASPSSSVSGRLSAQNQNSAEATISAIPT